MLLKLLSAIYWQIANEERAERHSAAMGRGWHIVVGVDADTIVSVRAGSFRARSWPATPTC